MIINEVNILHITDDLQILDGLISLNINKLYNEIVDTAEFKLTRKINYNLKLRDYIQITLNSRNANEKRLDINKVVIFKGYITEIIEGEEIVVKCNDKIEYTKYVDVKSLQIQNTTLKKVIDYCDSFYKNSERAKGLFNDKYLIFKPKIYIDELIADIPFSKFTIAPNENMYNVIKAIRESYGVVVYTDNLTNEIRFMTPYLLKDSTERVFRYDTNVYSSSLNYVTKTSYDLKVVYKGITRKKEKIESSFGTGESIRTYWHYGNTTKNELLRLAKLKHSEFVFDGFEGDFTIMADKVNIGDTIRIVDYKYDKKAFCSGIKIDANSDGFSQTITVSKELKN